MYINKIFVYSTYKMEKQNKNKKIVINNVHSN